MAMPGLPQEIVWAVDSQDDGIEFLEPTQPDGGYHSITPALPDYEAHAPRWVPNSSWGQKLAAPVEPPVEAPFRTSHFITRAECLIRQ